MQCFNGTHNKKYPGASEYLLIKYLLLTYYNQNIKGSHHNRLFLKELNKQKAVNLELMELENIVANTVYLKAREGNYYNFEFTEKFTALKILLLFERLLQLSCFLAFVSNIANILYLRL